MRAVRNMVGFLIAVGKGDFKPEDTVSILSGCLSRAKMPPMASAYGLYFLDADFQGDDLRSDL